MLFLGTERNRLDENAWETFLSSHGGSSNASTGLIILRIIYLDSEYTSFYFTLPLASNEDACAIDTVLTSTLELFSSFFVCPLLNIDGMKREREAVHSEWKDCDQNEYVLEGELLIETCSGCDWKEEKLNHDSTAFFFPIVSDLNDLDHVSEQIEEGSVSESGEEDVDEDSEESDTEVGVDTKNEHLLALDKTHPFSRFGWGNRDSLSLKVSLVSSETKTIVDESLETSEEDQAILLQNALRAFFNRYYFAEAMSLCICSNLKTEALLPLIERIFSEIPSKPRVVVNPIESLIPNFCSFGSPFDSSCLKHSFSMISHKQQNHFLTLTWSIQPPIQDKIVEIKLNDFSLTSNLPEYDVFPPIRSIIRMMEVKL